MPEMPDLPEPDGVAVIEDGIDPRSGGVIERHVDAWTEELVRAYALSYGAAVREECAKVPEAMMDPSDDGWDECLRICAAAIRKEE